MLKEECEDFNCNSLNTAYTSKNSPCTNDSNSKPKVHLKGDKELISKSSNKIKNIKKSGKESNSDKKTNIDSKHLSTLTYNMIKTHYLECLESKIVKRKLINYLSQKLSDISEYNSKSESFSPEDLLYQHKTNFYNEEIPETSLNDYLIRIVEMSKLELSSIILASIYLDRFCEKSTFYLTWNNVYR